MPKIIVTNKQGKKFKVCTEDLTPHKEPFRVDGCYLTVEKMTNGNIKFSEGSSTVVSVQSPEHARRYARWILKNTEEEC